MKIQAQVALGGGLAPAMAGPVQAVGHQLNDRRVNDVHGAFETTQGGPAAPAHKRWLQAAQVVQNFSKELLGHCGWADFVGDGLANEWERTYFGDLSQSGAGDYDRDGRTNFEEFAAGTNPSEPVALSLVVVEGQIVARWTARPDYAQILESSDEVGGAPGLWREYSRKAAAPVGPVSVTVTNDSVARFLRLRLE